MAPKKKSQPKAGRKTTQIKQNLFVVKTLKKITGQFDNHPRPGCVYRAVCYDESERLTGWTSWQEMEQVRAEHEKHTDHITDFEFKSGAIV